MNNENRWLFSRITDYTDYRTKAIYSYSEEIARLDEDARQVIYREIGIHIRKMTDYYFEKNLDICSIVGVVVNDLYRTMNMATAFTWVQSDYLNATMKVFFEQFKKYGISVHFGTNNEYSNPQVVLKLFPAFFDACGFRQYDAYTAINSLALMGGVQIPDDELLPAFLEYKTEILKIINSAVTKSNVQKENYALILPRGGGNDFDSMLSTIDERGYLNYFKNTDADSSQLMTFPFSR